MWNFVTVKEKNCNNLVLLLFGEMNEIIMEYSFCGDNCNISKLAFNVS